jgi:hypothetical protein
MVKEMKVPPLIRDSMLLKRGQMKSELDILMVSWGTKFDDLTNFLEDKI